MRPPKAAHSAEQCHHQQVGDEVQRRKTVSTRGKGAVVALHRQVRRGGGWSAGWRVCPETPERSLRHRAQSLGLKKSSVNEIIRKDLRLQNTSSSNTVARRRETTSEDGQLASRTTSCPGSNLVLRSGSFLAWWASELLKRCPLGVSYAG